MPHPPTPEQAAIIHAAKHSTASLMISAFAGTAKTTTIEMLAPVLPTISVLALAFNVKIKDELIKRLPSTFTVKTLNGLGHGAWAKATGKRITLETTKLGKIITAVAKENNIPLDSKETWVNIKDLVEGARTNGLVPSTYPHARGLLSDTKENWVELAESLDITAEPLLLDLARACLIESIKQAYTGLIDFSDQIYMSVCFGGVFPRFHTVIVDEAQDLSPMNHVMLRKCVANRLIVCGDPKQSLYQFRGAATDSMGKIRALRESWEDYNLTVTFRCPKAIVARQQEHAPGYTAAPQAPEGLVVNWLRADALPQHKDTPHWTYSDILRAVGVPEGHRPAQGALAILCRNNAPLITIAFRLIRKGQGVGMLGRDLGKGLISNLKKVAPDSSMPIAEVAGALLAWKDREASILRANEKNSALEKLYDRYESIMAVLESTEVRTQHDLCLAIESLFSKDSGLISLATAHRAKGLEWDHVLHLDPWRMPSKYATSPEALAQEANAEYVVETRAKQTLLLANLEDFK